MGIEKAMDSRINSKAYWDDRFKTDWEEMQGREQTRFFCNIAVEKLPNWLKERIAEDKMTICDWGCAEGDGTEVLATALKADVTGMDFSGNAIATAKSYYPSCRFLAEDILKEEIDERFDIVFSSNTLEHFSDPWIVVDKLSRIARKALIFLLPFREFDRIPEHEYSFDFDNIPVKIGNLRLCHAEVFDAARMKPTYWPGEQVLLIYADSDLYPMDASTLCDMRLDGKDAHEEKQVLEAQLHYTNNALCEAETALGDAKDSIAALKNELESVLAQRQALQAKIELLEQERCSINSELDSVGVELEGVQRQIEEMLNSRSWKITAPMRTISSALLSPERRKKVSYYATRASQGIARHGVKKAIPKSILTAKTLVEYEWRKVSDKKGFDERLAGLATRIHQPYAFIDVFPVAMGWDTPLFQRFQHFSIQASRLGGLAIYGGHPQVDQRIQVYREVMDNLLIFDATDPSVSEAVFSALATSGNRVVLRMQSIDTATSIEEIRLFLEKGFEVVYEYIDEITDVITGLVPESIRERHLQILDDERIHVVATSDKLFRQVKGRRGKNCRLLTNGVDLDHWGEAASVPEELEELRQQAQFVIGYHGALAAWVDYELLKKVADLDGVEVLLIGHKHDASFDDSGLGSHKHVHFIGSRSYFELNRYARIYDVGILPFVRNELTESVSPVKIFEYMATGIPIVTTDLPECRKYRSCLVASSHDVFLENIVKAISLKSDPDYQDILAEEASQNSWDHQARQLYYNEGGR